MGSGVHHVSCFADDESVSVFLQRVVGLSVFDRFAAPPAVTSSMFGWPADNPGSVGARYGAGPNGLVEVMSIPAELKGTVTPGLGFATFTVKDLEACLDDCRRLGFDVGAVGRFDPTAEVGLAAALVTVGGVVFELVRYERK